VKESFIKKPLVRVSLFYGLFGGVVMIILIIGLQYVGRNPLTDIRVVDLVILSVFLFFAMREYRDRYNDRILYYWQGVSIGILTFLTIALISATFIYILTEFIKPEMVSQYIDSRLDLLQQNKQQLVSTINETAYNKALEGVKQTTSADLGLDDLLKKSFIGLFLTIIIAVILRKKPN
jgi:hypothetical protein